MPSVTRAASAVVVFLIVFLSLPASAEVVFPPKLVQGVVSLSLGVEVVENFLAPDEENHHFTTYEFTFNVPSHTTEYLDFTRSTIPHDAILRLEAFKSSNKYSKSNSGHVSVYDFYRNPKPTYLAFGTGSYDVYATLLTDEDPPIGFELSLSPESISVLTAPIPEPSTWIMLLLGFAGIGFMAQQRANKVLMNAV